MEHEERLRAGDALWAAWLDTTPPLAGEQVAALVAALRSGAPSVGHVVSRLAQAGPLPAVVVTEALATTEDGHEMVWMRRHVRARQILDAGGPASEVLDTLLQRGLSWAVLEWIRSADAAGRGLVRERLLQDAPFTRRQRAVVVAELDRLGRAGAVGGTP